MTRGRRPRAGAELVTGIAVGQGMETILAQICADTPGIEYRRVRVIHGGTDRIAFDQDAFVAGSRDDRRSDALGCN